MELSNLNILLQAFRELAWQNMIMLGIGGLLIFLAVKFEFEPNLLLPIGFGAILANLPLTGITGEGGFLKILYDTGIATELFPLFIFIGIGAMTDFGPLLESPKMAMLGRGRPIWNFFHAHAGPVGGFPAQRGRVDWHYWRD